MVPMVPGIGGIASTSSDGPSTSSAGWSTQHRARRVERCEKSPSSADPISWLVGGTIIWKTIGKHRKTVGKPWENGGVPTAKRWHNYGWWNMIVFLDMLGIMIPTDFHIFRRGRYHQPVTLW